ncbi:armadillo-type protein [Phascolomyces articulosus]|uniref:Exportin-4 n=1 Tax=Phascolomyces articulosus TaxID=60185 RepID=A0AAD5K6M0_9FUNG|nr:armadillo-type protein [Phascolomyces articulosus]
MSEAETICAQFEEACADFQVPATRAAAEQILSSFRQIPKVLPVCKFILDNAQSPMARFQVALAIGEVSMRDYTLYPQTDLIQLKNYMIEYCLKNTDLMKYVREQLLCDAALITKRTLFDISDTDRESIYVSLEQLFGMEDHGSIIGVALASALVDQFSTTRSSTVGLSWEFHHKAKVFFETHILHGIFEKSVTRLHTLITQIQQQQTSIATPPPLLTELITLIEKILQWQFESTNNGAVLPGTFAKKAEDDDFDKEDGPGAVKKTYTIFPKHWHSLVANTDVIWLFFTTYSLIQTDDVLGHRCRQCLVQMAGFNEEFFDHDINRAKQYATTFIHGTAQMMGELGKLGNDPEAYSENGPHLLGTIQIARRICENLSLATLWTIPEFYKFMDDFGEITVVCLRSTATRDIDEGWISEASDECLETWVRLAEVAQPSDGRGNDPKAGLSENEVQELVLYIKNGCTGIVTTFIESKLLQSQQTVLDDEEDEDISSGFKDWDTFADQLSYIGTLGRLDPARSLLNIHQLMDGRFQLLKQYFTMSGMVNEDNHLYHLQEHLHWLILISAHVLADPGAGEQPMIPDSLMHLSGSQTLEDDQVTNLSKLILEIFRFLSSFGANTIEASNCSPQVAETLIWYMERWSKTYVLLDENEYGYMSPNIARAFGRPGPSDGLGLEIIDFFIDQIKANFVLWSADPDVLVQIIRWLHSCGISTNLKTGLLQSSKFPDLVQFVTANLSQLPENVHNSLIQTIATISSGANDAQVRDQYLGLIYGMIEKRLASVLHHPEFVQNFQRVDMMNDVMNALEMFDGLALACQYNNTQSIFTFCSRFFESMHQLMNMYKSVPEVQLLLLQFFADLAGRLDFGLLEPNQKQLLFQIVVEILKSYGASNRGKKRIHTQEEEADRPYPDIATALSLLTNIMASEFEDFNRTENATPTAPGNADVADVVLFGVNVIIPMIDLEMLKIPSLCQQYIRLISNLIEFFPDKLAALPQDLFNNLMASLEFGVGHDIADVNVLALQAVAPLALWAHNQMLANSNVDFLKPALRKFLEQLIKLLLFENLDSSVVDGAAEALLSLICAEREEYYAVVNQIISQQANEIQPRLLHAFEKLDATTPRELRGVLPPSRNVTGFKEALFVFLVDVRAVLRIK